jgi:hypothetical protein
MQKLEGQINKLLPVCKKNFILNPVILLDLDV